MPSIGNRSLALIASAALIAAVAGTARVIAQAPAGGALRWVKAAPFPEPEEELYAVTVNNKMYVIAQAWNPGDFAILEQVGN